MLKDLLHLTRKAVLWGVIAVAAIIIALSLMFMRPRMQMLTITLVFVACGEGLLSYKRNLRKHAEWRMVDAHNQKLKSLIEQQVDLNTAVLYSNMQVRGYSNLLFNRGMYEHTPQQSGQDLMILRNAECAIYLDAIMPFTDLPKFTQAIITHKDGAVTTVVTED